MYNKYIREKHSLTSVRRNCTPHVASLFPSQRQLATPCTKPDTRRGKRGNETEG